MSLFVVFSVAGSEYALPALDVLQIESFTGATRVPSSEPYVSGIVALRGRVLPVLDLRARFGHPPPDEATAQRLIVIAHASRVVGLLADSAHEVVELDAQAREPVPAVVSERSRGFVCSTYALGKRLFLLLALDKVIGEGPQHDASARFQSPASP